MAREIPKTHRTVMEQAASLPHATGGARLAEMLGGIANKAGEFTGKLRLEDAVVQGAQDRFDKGNKKLAPGLNATTQAYNKAFLSMDNQLNILSIDNEMQRTYLEMTKPGSFNYETPALFAQYARKQIEGVMQNIPVENRPEFALHAAKAANNYELQLQYLANQKSAEDLKASGQVTLTKNLEDVQNAIRNEQPGLAQEAIETFKHNLGDVKKVTGMNAKDEYLYNESLKQTEISSMYYKRGQNDAIASPGTAEQQLYEFAVNPPNDLSPTEQDIALKAYAEGVGHVDKFKNEQNTVNSLTANRDINNGTIKNSADLQMRAEDVDAASYIRLEDHLYQKNSAKVGGQEAVNNFVQRAQMGGGFQNIKTPDKVKEAAFVQLKDAYLSKKREEAEDPFLELSPQDEANVLMQLNASIPSVDARVNYSISKGDSATEVGNIAWALGMVRGVGAEKPNTINLTDKNRAIAIMANASLQWGGETNPGKAIEAARATVNAKESEYIGRAYNFRNKTKTEIQDAFTKVFPSADPTKDKTAFGVFVQNYESNYLMTDSDDEALEATRQKMQNTFGTSRYFREGQVGYLPLEKVIPGAELGGRVWLSNQVKLLALKVAESHKNATPDELDPNNKVEWVGKDIPDAESKILNLPAGGIVPKGNLTQDQLFLYGGVRLGVSENQSSTGIMYRIKGQNRPVYVEADSMSRVGDGDGLNIRFYTINPDTKLKEYVVDPKSRSGFAYQKVQGLQQFLPEVYKNLTEDNIDSWANKVVVDEYKGKHKIPVLRAFGFADYVKSRKPEVIKELKGYGAKDNQEDITHLGTINIFDAYEEMQQGQSNGNV